MKKLWVFEWNWTKQELCWRQLHATQLILFFISSLWEWEEMIEKNRVEGGCSIDGRIEWPIGLSFGGLWAEQCSAATSQKKRQAGHLISSIKGLGVKLIWLVGYGWEPGRTAKKRDEPQPTLPLSLQPTPIQCCLLIVAHWMELDWLKKFTNSNHFNSFSLAVGVRREKRIEWFWAAVAGRCGWLIGLLVMARHRQLAKKADKPPPPPNFFFLLLIICFSLWNEMEQRVVFGRAALSILWMEGAAVGYRFGPPAPSLCSPFISLSLIFYFLYCWFILFVIQSSLIN